jgi:hypothetical protein
MICINEHYLTKTAQSPQKHAGMRAKLTLERARFPLDRALNGRPLAAMHKIGKVMIVAGASIPVAAAPQFAPLGSKRQRR